MTCRAETYVGPEVTDDGIRVVAGCNANQGRPDCGFVFLWRDEDGETVTPDGDGWWLTSGEMREWDATHRAWSRMTAEERFQYETEIRLIRPKETPR